MRLVRVGAVALNQTPLDWQGNRRRIEAAIDDAREHDVRVLCLPELCITGYGCEDAFHSRSVQEHALEMLLTGEPIDAQTALAWGLVNRVVPASKLDVEIEQFTAIILSRSSAVVRLGKQAFYGQIDRPLEAAYDTASEMMARNLLLEDAAEGMDAFLQKRLANWRGR